MKNLDVMTNAINQPTSLLQFMGSCVLRSAPSLQVSFKPATQTDRGDRRISPDVSGVARFSPVSGRFAHGSFRLRSVRLRLESIRLRLICQFAYESDVEALNRNY